MNKVVLFSDLYLPTFPYLEVPLYKELRKRNISVDYVMQHNDIRLTDPELLKTFSTLNVKTIKSPAEISKILTKNDLYVSRFCYKEVGGKVANIAKKSCGGMLMMDPAGVDLFFRECPADYVTAKSQWMAGLVSKKYAGKYKEVFVTGTIHFDAAATVKGNKEEIMKAYGLNANKKLVIVCKASPGEVGHQKGVDAEYKEIVNIIRKQCPGYELLFKVHPLDYHSFLPNQPGVFHKNIHYNQKPSWEILFPGGIKLLDPAEGYKAFSCADVVVNVRSSIGMEVPLFSTPLVNVNSHKYIVNWPKPEEGVCKYINMEQLATTLNSSNYAVDKKKRAAYVSKYCHSNDGKAYIRTANAIEKLLRT